MEKISLIAQKRTVLGKQVAELRRNNIIPAVIYGKKENPANIQVDAKKFDRIFKKAGTSALVDLKIDDDKDVKILIQDVQFDPITGNPIHADFYKIRRDEKLTTEIPLKFIGISPAVKELEGNFISNYDEIEVECLPDDLIPEIVVDISGLKTFDDQIKVSELNIPSNIKVLTNVEEVVALVNPPRSEEELEAMEAESVADAEKAGIEEMEKKAEDEKAEKEAEKEASEKADQSGEKSNTAPKTEEKK